MRRDGQEALRSIWVRHLADSAGIDQDAPVLNGEWEAIHASGRGTIQVFAVAVFFALVVGCLFAIQFLR